MLRSLEVIRVAQGKVKWFSSQKGFGFIEQESGPDLFVHHKAIQGEGFKNLNEGDIVEYNVTNGPKGESAVDVKVISQNPQQQQQQQQPRSNGRGYDRGNRGYDRGSDRDQDKPFNRSIEDQLKALRKSSKENQQDLANRLKRR